MGRKYKCPYCEVRKERKDLIIHIDIHHKELLPDGYDGEHKVYDYINNKNGYGICRVCGGKTKWNNTSGRYNVLCGSKKCKEKMREDYRKNMIKVYNTDNILNDPEQQKKMLANRKISGEYKFTDGGKVMYTGSYELKCLEFLDVIMNIRSTDILVPGPTLYYEYKGQKHFYLPDIYYPNLNLLIEIKDGGDNLNTKDTPGMRSSREKTIEKERVITNRGEYNYVRLTDNNFAQIIEIFMELKEQCLNGVDKPIVKINESYVTESSLMNFYFISDKNMDGKILHPRVPINYLTKNNYEDNTTKRVCFSKSIDGCLSAMSSNIDGKEFYVHKPIGKYNIYEPTLKEVPDCKITDEVWIKESVKVKCIGKIKVSANDSPGMGYSYGNNYRAELYLWDYKWINKDYGINKSYINESTKSNIDENYKPNGKKNLSSFKKVHITDTIISKYKKEYPFLSNVRCKDTKDYICDGYIWFDKDELVCMVGSCQYRDDKTKWVVSLEIIKKYRGYGLSKQILDYAVKTMNCKYLSVNKNNKVAKKVYDDYGFKVYQEDDTMYYMTIDKINESCINESFKDELSSIKNPKELSAWMKTNIKYKEYDKLMTAEDVYNKKCGSCHDQVIFEEVFFKKWDIKHGKIFFIEYNEGEQIGGNTHTLLYYIESNKYYWFENAWGGQEGIHGPYNSLNDLKEDVKSKDLKNSKFKNVEFSSVKNIKTGMSLGDYVNACLESYGIHSNYMIIDELDHRRVEKINPSNVINNNRKPDPVNKKKEVHGDGSFKDMLDIEKDKLDNKTESAISTNNLFDFDLL